MTQKDYAAIANTISGDIAINRDNPTAFFAVRNVTLSLCDVFKRDNERFDRKRFLTACGFRPEDAPYTFGEAEA